MKINAHEMRGLLTGKCLPGDMMVNEELPDYLVRKFRGLHDQHDVLAAENAALKELYRQSVKDLEDTCFEIGMMRGEKSMEYPAPETPATDAYLNSVRADGVEAFAQKQRVIADSLSGDAQRSHRITACRAEDFANQIRAGEPS